MLSTLREHTLSDGADANVSVGRPQPLAGLSRMNSREAWTDFDISKDHATETSGHDEPDNWWSPATPDTRPHSTSMQVFARRDSPSVPRRFSRGAEPIYRNNCFFSPPTPRWGTLCAFCVRRTKSTYFFFSFPLTLSWDARGQV